MKIGLWPAALVCLSLHALAANYEPDPDPAVNAWYGKVISNDHVSCCGVADAYWAFTTRVNADGSIEVQVQDDRAIEGRTDLDGHTFTVPPDKIDRRMQGNPTGHEIIFVAGAYVICFFPGGGV